MHELDLTLATPAENLACDEALLDACHQGGPEVLRFWEPAGRFVVLGYANRLATEVDAAACQDFAVPIFRRITGGGTVVQMPGCLNYSLVLRLDGDAWRQTIPATNRFVLERIAAALRPLVGRGVRLQGDTDLALGLHKFAGNAQRRLRDALLFHGCLLLDADLDWIGRLLPFPSRQPAYRAGRAHRDFVANLGLPAAAVKEAIRAVWNATAPLPAWPRAAVQTLAQTKYANPDWTRRF